MSSFKEFQKQRAREEAERRNQEKQHAESDLDDDSDVDEEYALLGLSAGNWVQIALFGLYWVLGAQWFISGTAHKNQTPEVLPILLSAIPALVLSILTWRWIGSRAREGLRWVARLTPVVIIGVLTLRLFGADVPLPREVAPPVATAGAPVPTKKAQPQTRDFRSRMAADPAAEVRAFQAALTGENPTEAEAALRGLAEAQRQCTKEALRARYKPASPPSLSTQLKCLRAIQSLRPTVRAWATGREQELVKWFDVDPGSAAATLALGLGRPEPAVLSALVPRLGSSLPSVADDTLEALTELGLEAPQVVLAAVRASPEEESPRARINRLRLEARLGPSREEGCRALAERVVQENAEENQLAVEALRGLDGVCDEVAGLLLQHLRSSQNVFAAQALAFTGLAHWAELRALEQELGEKHPLLVSMLQTTRAELVENDQVRRMGITAQVLNHPNAVQGADRPKVVLGPCPPERLGASPDDMPPHNVPQCVLEVSGGSALTMPLTAWQAQARGTPLADFEAALGPL